jgi:hypothetical protein
MHSLDLTDLILKTFEVSLVHADYRKASRDLILFAEPLSLRRTRAVVEVVVTKI